MTLDGAGRTVVRVPCPPERTGELLLIVQGCRVRVAGVEGRVVFGCVTDVPGQVALTLDTSPTGVYGGGVVGSEPATHPERK